ncbi:unnamed protein product [Mytilus edulis]|uniref:B box-type domain-containing protein n=1 Tax=Mytilus edulis TaxID=6550 RepID=A0A8S3TYR1_MYTED|nr:unnamed protein product [Mytilus edulis]
MTAHIISDSFDILKFIFCRSNLMSMASENHICNLCGEEDVTKFAVVWCADCETFLCKDCKIYHGRIKASKGHQTITLDEYNNLPSFVVDIRSRCKKHDEKCDFYCKFHDDPCCVKCIKDNHKDCRDLDTLVEVLRDIKTSARVSNLDKELNILLENFETQRRSINTEPAWFSTSTLTMNLDGNILSEIKVPGKYTIRAALSNNNIVCTDWHNSYINCFGTNGILLWKNKNKDICEPFGITVDKHGFIFVASRKNYKIVVLSEDGRTCKTILSKENGIVSPIAKNIDKSSSKLMVTNSSHGDAYVFEIEN